MLKMSDEKKKPSVTIGVKFVDAPIKKALSDTAMEKTDEYTAGEWLEPPVPLQDLYEMYTHSSTLPQCVAAYERNIAGFGISIEYCDDKNEDEAMSAEYTKAEKILSLMNFDKPIEGVFKEAIRSREIYGIAYIEIIRNAMGDVVQIENIRDVDTIQKSVLSKEWFEVQYMDKGVPFTYKKRFRKYRQQVSGKYVYFKEFGDKRTLDIRSGDYVDEVIPAQYQANEILEIKIGSMPYGEVRWIGQTLSVDGSRRAENLNNTYFRKGRHTPMAILVKGGTLSQKSYTNLQQNITEIEGEKGQHAFMVLELEGLNSDTGFENTQRPEVEIKDLAPILQKDELFQEYLDNNRRRIQSAFQLPDIYVGYSSDYTRATAQVAMEVTEQQVFQPERASLEWIINNKLLNGYGFKYVHITFKAPEIRNPDDLSKILGITERAGGLTPNKAKEVTYKFLGDEYEDYPDEWGNIPIALASQQSSASPASADETLIAKSSDDVISVLKSIRDRFEE